jgi:signal transduction histidine kinase
MFGDALPCALLIIAALATRENFRLGSGILPLFWKLVSVGLLTMLASQGYWFYYDAMRRTAIPTPVPGDLLFLLAHVFFLAALALRPHSISAGRDLRLRRLDLTLLTMWWFTLYGYFSLPWQISGRNFAEYNPTYYFLAFVQHIVLAVALAVLCFRNRGTWRRLYGHLLVAFGLVAAGNLLVNVAIDRGFYYSGGFCDTAFMLALVWIIYCVTLGPALRPREDHQANRELTQRVWTARIAMLAMLSLPVIALVGYVERNVPAAITAIRLRVVFGAMFLLGVLVFWKLQLLARELNKMVELSQESLENLKVVQQRVSHSEKLAALGRLASGAAHEISNPLTAILGYSELLADIPALGAEDRGSAQLIQRQVHRAQAAVNSLRETLRRTAEPQAAGPIKIRAPRS